MSNLGKQCRITKSICLRKVKINYISGICVTADRWLSARRKGKLGKSVDFHGDIFKGVRKMKSNIDK